MSNPSAATISALYPGTMNVILGDDHPSDLKRLDKPCALVRGANLRSLDP